MLEEDTVWKCVFNLVYVHDNSKGKDRGLKNQGYMITLNKNPSYRPEFSARYEVSSNLTLAVGSLQIFIQLIPNTVNMVNN